MEINHGSTVRSGETIDKGVARVAVEAPGLKRSQRKLRFYIMKRARKRLLAEVQPSCSRDLGILEMLIPWGSTMNSSNYGVELIRA